LIYNWNLFWIFQERNQDWLSRGFFDQEDVHKLILLVLTFKNNTCLLHHKGNNSVNCVEPVFFKLLCRLFFGSKICSIGCLFVLLYRIIDFWVAYVVYSEIIGWKVEDNNLVWIITRCKKASWLYRLYNWVWLVEIFLFVCKKDWI